MLSGARESVLLDGLLITPLVLRWRRVEEVLVLRWRLADQIEVLICSLGGAAEIVVDLLVVEVDLVGC